MKSMTREELIEMLWEEYSVAVRDEDYGYMRVIDDVSFVSAVKAALDAQARGCVKAARLFTYGYGDKVAEKMISHILTADPEVTP